MSTMTLEQVRDWHRKQAYACGLFERDQDEGYAHDRMADAIDAHLAHLAQPAQAVTGSRCEDCSEPTGQTAVCSTCAGLRCESVLKATQAVDVVAWRWRDDARHGLPWDVTEDEDVIAGMRRTGGYEIEPLTRALTSEKAGLVETLQQALADISKAAISDQPEFAIRHYVEQRADEAWDGIWRPEYSRPMTTASSAPDKEGQP